MFGRFLDIPLNLLEPMLLPVPSVKSAAVLFAIPEEIAAAESGLLQMRLQRASLQRSDFDKLGMIGFQTPDYLVNADSRSFHPHQLGFLQKSVKRDIEPLVAPGLGILGNQTFRAFLKVCVNPAMNGFVADPAVCGNAPNQLVQLPGVAQNLSFIDNRGDNTQSVILRAELPADGLR